MARFQDEPRAAISARARSLRMSPMISRSLRAEQMRVRGRDVVSLAVGELDFNTPGAIIEAAAAAAFAGATRYTAPDGTAALKRAVCAKFQRDNDLVFSAGEIHVAGGAKQVIHNAFFATLEEGDEVVLVAPFWPPYRDLVEQFGARAVVVEAAAEHGFQPEPQAIEEAITPRTKWLVLNSPNNPTGAVYSAERLSAIAEIVLRTPGLLVLSDEIYEHLVFDGRRHSSIAAVEPRIRPQTLVVNGVSKAYAMTGWRIGFAGGPAWLVEAMALVQSQVSGNPASISQAAAIAALEGPQQLIAEWRATLQGRRDHALAILRSSPRIQPIRSEGAFYLFCGVQACIGLQSREGRLIASDTILADYLLDRAGVAVVPGDVFESSPFLRISIALDAAVVGAACRRIVEAIDELEPCPSTAEPFELQME